MGKFPHDDNIGSPDRPWFFNASGTRAQTMRLTGKTLTQVLNGVVSQAHTLGLDRLYIELQDGRVVSTQNRGNLAGYHTSMQCQITTLGKDEYATQSTLSSNGEYVIGVDYQGDQEVLAKISYEASEQIDSHHGVDSSSRSLSTEIELLTIGSQTYKLIDDSNSDVQSSGQQGYQEQINHRGKALYLYSIDMHDDLLAYYAGSVVDNTFIQGMNNYYSMALNSQVEDVDLVRFEGMDREAFKNTQSFTGVYKLYSELFRIRGCQTGILGTSLYSTETKSLPISPTHGFAYNRMKGAWSADTAGRLFVSQTKGSLQYLVPSDTFYNFLSGGIPDSLISPPADKQNFVPIGLIR